MARGADRTCSARWCWRRASRTLRAELRYCEGHLHRIDGEAETRGTSARRRSQQFTDAVAAFREAAELRRGWPDPFLGLARVFIYGLDDIDRAADAMQAGAGLGYTPGDRETAQLADGYRVARRQLWRTARQLADLPQETDYLQRATDAYKQARRSLWAHPGVSRRGVQLSAHRPRCRRHRSPPFAAEESDHTGGRMAVTYTTAAATRAARTRERSVVDRWELALAGISVFAVVLILSAFFRAVDQREIDRGAGDAINLNTVRDANALEPVLGRVLPQTADQRLAAHAIFSDLVQADGGAPDHP